MNIPKAIVLLLLVPCLIQAQEYAVAVVGAGAGGTMAAKRALLNNRNVLLFTGAKKEMKRSRGYWVRKVDNVPGLEKYSRTIVQLQKEMLQGVAKSPLKDKLSLVEDSVVSIKKNENGFELTDKAGKTYRAKYVVLATGMMDEQPHIKGSIRPILPYANKQTVAYCVLCDGHKSYNKETVVIGYSEDAAKAALVLESRYTPKKLTLLTNGHKPEISEETKALLIAKKIDVVTEPIIGVQGRAKGVLSGFQLEKNKRVNAEVGFVMLGIRPNNSLAKQLGAALDAKGLVVTDANGESSIPNLFVVGDLRSNGLKQIYTAWQHAVDSVQVIDKRIRAD